MFNGLESLGRNLDVRPGPDNNARLLTALEGIFDVVGEECHLVYRRLSAVKARLVFRQLRVDHRVEACV